MAKTIDIHITESVEELKYQLEKTKSKLTPPRLKALLLIKRNKCKYTKDVAAKVGASRKTVYNWLESYRTGGLEELIKVHVGGNNTKLLSDTTIKEIDRLLNDSYSSIVSYVELVSILEETTQENITYASVYQHCKRKHKSKLKVARKSHHKKDDQAVAAFKKTT